MESAFHLVGRRGRRSRPLPGIVRGVELRRVLPIVRSCQVEGGSVTLVSLELYEDGSILRYYAVPAQPLQERSLAVVRDIQRLAQEGRAEELRAYVEQRMLGMPREFGQDIGVRMEDDAGTQYESMPRGGGGGDYRWEASIGFTPRVPAEAKRLTLTLLEGARMPPPVRRPGWSAVGGARPTGQPVATFSVDL